MSGTRGTHGRQGTRGKAAGSGGGLPDQRGPGDRGGRGAGSGWVPSFSLTGRVALITGGGRGIGLGMARALASAGCAVAVQDIDAPAASDAAGSINRSPAVRSAGGRAVALGGDVTDLSLPPRAVAETVDQLGALHILVNNAAVQKYQDWLDLTPEGIDHQVRGDFTAPLLFCKEAVGHFRRQKWGRVLNLGSIQQQSGNPDMMPYAMSKSALENMTRALARQLAPDGITVNLLAPGYFNTYRNREQFKTPEDLAAKGREHVPLGRIGQPEDFAGITLLLCSDAGAYITGQSIYVDGGMSVR